MTKIEQIYRAFLASGRPGAFTVTAIASAIATKHMLSSETVYSVEEEVIELERCYNEISEYVK
jgi:hypothetical protein